MSSFMDMFRPYSEQSHGDLREYILSRSGHGCYPLFSGYDVFEKMQQMGMIIPNVTIVRLMWNVGREDEHFFVTKEYQLEGINAPAHAGRNGIHNPRKVLNEAPWEIHYLNIQE